MKWELHAALGAAVVFTGVRMILDAARDAYADGHWDGGMIQIQLCKEAGHFDEPGGTPASEPGDGPRDASGEG